MDSSQSNITTLNNLTSIGYSTVSDGSTDTSTTIVKGDLQIDKDTEIIGALTATSGSINGVSIGATASDGKFKSLTAEDLTVTGTTTTINTNDLVIEDKKIVIAKSDATDSASYQNAGICFR